MMAGRIRTMLNFQKKGVFLTMIQVLRRPVPRPEPEYTVYLYVLSGKAVYAGATRNLPQRMLAHDQESDIFQECALYFHRCSSEKEMFELETVVINAFDPEKNIAKKMPGKTPIPELG